MFNIKKIKKSLCTALFLSLTLSGTAFAAPGAVTIKAPFDGIDIDVYKIGERQGNAFIPDNDYPGLTLDFSENANERMAKTVSDYVSEHDIKADISESTKNGRILLEEPDNGIYFVMLSENEEDVLMTPFIFEVPDTDAVTGNNGRFFEVSPKYEDPNAPNGPSHGTSGGWSGVVSSKDDNVIDISEAPIKETQETEDTHETTSGSKEDERPSDSEDKKGAPDILNGTLQDTGDHTDRYLIMTITSGIALIVLGIYSILKKKKK